LVEVRRAVVGCVDSLGDRGLQDPLPLDATRLQILLE
jgi:hypothetical protein